MAFTNYTTFVATVANYLARSDLTSVIPDFVQLAQERISRDLRVQEMLKVATATTVAGDKNISFPADFLELREIHIDGTPVYTLEYQTPDKFFRNGKTHQSGVPTHFTMLGAEFQFAPVPDGTKTVQILYYAKPSFISASQASNVFLAYFPDALLYATLAEAEPYLMNDERVQVWASLYDRAIQNIRENDKGATFSSATLNVTTS
jgi:hypothetical protein